jgi:general secretion pathway protein G
MVLSLLSLLATMVMSTHRNSVKKAQEKVLRNNLHQIRITLDQYHVDKGRYPDSLQTMVDEGYFREMPYDPITQSRDTWEEVFEQDISDEDSSYEPGVWDVRSGSAEEALDGTYYGEW